MIFSSEEEDFLLVMGFTFLQGRVVDKALVVFNALKINNPQNVVVLKCLLYLSILKHEYNKAYSDLQVLKNIKDLESRDRKWLLYIQIFLKNQISAEKG